MSWCRIAVRILDWISLGWDLCSKISWRYGYYVGAILTFDSFIFSIFGIPVDIVLVESQSFGSVLQRMKTEIDLIGCCLLSSSLGLFSYVLSVLASGVSHFLAPTSITLFSIAVVLIPIFIWHTRRQERLNQPAIIPPSLWSNPVFTSLCITVFLIWGVFSAIEFFLTLFYQSVQQLSPL